MPAVVRLRMPDGVTEWDDVVRGHVSFNNADIDDQVLLKSDGFPTYHLAVVVDDHLMEISHVIRSDEWIPSTPKHLALYAAFGWDRPRFAHVPAVLGPDHQKLSKRRGARNVLEYGELGYLPSAIVNAIALLGWSSGDEQEVFTPEELCERFTLERVNSAAAIFDPKRLDDLNGIHIRRMSTDDLVEALEFHLPGTSKETRRQLIPLLRERMVTLADATRLCAPLLGEVTLDASVEFPPKKVDQATAVAMIDACIEAIEGGALEDHDGLLERLRAVAETAGVKSRDAFRVLYVAILGTPAGLPVIEAMEFLGEEKSSAASPRGSRPAGLTQSVQAQSPGPSIFETGAVLRPIWGGVPDRPVRRGRVRGRGAIAWRGSRRMRLVPWRGRRGCGGHRRGVGRSVPARRSRSGAFAVAG